MISRILLLPLIFFGYAVGFSQEKNSLLFPDCSKVESIDLKVNELSKDELRFIDYKTRDSLEALYCLGRKTGNPELEAIGLYRLGLSYQYEQNDVESFKKMIGLVEESLSISRKHNYDFSLMAALEAMITNFTSNNVFSQANLYADEFIQIARETQDSAKIAEGYMLKGRLLREEERFEESDSLLKKALDFQVNSTESNRVSAYTYLHLSHSYRKRGEYKKSLDYAKRGIDFANKSKDHKEFLLSSLSLEIIICNLELGDFDDKEYQNVLEQYAQKHPAGWVTGQFYYYQGLRNIKQGNFDEAKIDLFNALENSYNAGTRLNSIEIIETLLPFLYEQDADPEDILRVNEISSETIQDISEHTGSDNLFEMTYYKLKSEENQNKYLESTLSNYTKIIITSTLIIVLLFLLGLLYYTKSKQIKEFNQRLYALNKNLSSQNSQLEESNEQIKEQRDELEYEMKQQIVTLSSFRSLSSKIKRIVQKHQEINPKMKKEILQALEFDPNEETIEDINIKFLGLNEEFITQLNSLFPKLTSNDLKLCIYLKMNLSTKEIAQIQYKSVNTVKVARSRLRSKLEISDPNVNLTSFLNSILSEDKKVS